MGRIVLGVTGAPGAPLPMTAKPLEGRGWQILWPGQPLPCLQDQPCHDRGENPAVVTMHENILARLIQGRESS